ncbi:Retrotransposon protein [Nesidiocoris tenuis]|nr:Retrotransposon protein [Nesidiocoris tenuis]
MPSSQSICPDGLCPRQVRKRESGEPVPGAPHNCDSITSVARVTYKGAYEGLIGYACPVWEKAARKVHCRRKLISSQRSALLAVTRAYNTTSNDALQVVAGIPPIDLTIKKRALCYYSKRGRLLDIEGVSFEDGSTAKERKKKIEEGIVTEWQRRWSASSKGRETFKYWNDVRERLKQKTFVDEYTVQATTGHGDFNHKLASFRLVEDGGCTCGEMQTAEHLIWRCREYQHFRDELENMEQRKTNIAKNTKTWRKFGSMVKEIMKTKRYLRAYTQEACGPDEAVTVKSLNP